MTEQSFTDISLQAVKLADSIRQIAREHPYATWTPHPNDISGDTWGLMELADHLSAIHTVMGIIAETPNGYINREALEGLRDQLRPAIEFLDTPWSKKCQEEIDRRFFDTVRTD